MRLVALVGLVMPLALAAYAAMTASPSSGTAEPGETTTATINVEPTIVSVCLVGTSSDPINITVAFNPTCGGGPFSSWGSEMTITVGDQTAPGDYTITITSLDLGSLIYQWPLTVTGPSTTTTTVSTTTTTTVPTTSTTSPATTTTVAVATTTTSVNSPPTTSTVTPPTTTDHVASITTTTIKQALVAPAGPSDPGLGGDSEVGSPASPTRSGDTSDVAAPDESESQFSEVALSSGLIERLSGAVPTFVASAVTSPFVVAEVLLRALGRTVTGLLIPVVLMLLFGWLLFWRLRPDDEDLDADVFGDASLDLPGGGK